MNKLYYDGGLVPEKREAVTDAIADLYKDCVEAGATSLVMPADSIPYSDLVSAMRDSGALKTNAISAAGTGPVSISTPEETILLAEHREKVESENTHVVKL